MKAKTLIAGLFLFFVVNGYSQYYVDDYFITESGDTIFGKLKELSFKQSYLEISKNRIVSVKLIDGGRVKLCEFNVQSYYYDGNNRQWWTNKWYYIEKNGQIIPVRKMGFRRQMSKHFSDNEKLVDMIKKRKLKYNDMVKIVEIYNGKRPIL